jgi:hypothetical protein
MIFLHLKLHPISFFLSFIPFVLLCPFLPSKQCFLLTCLCSLYRNSSPYFCFPFTLSYFLIAALFIRIYFYFKYMTGVVSYIQSYRTQWYLKCLFFLPRVTCLAHVTLYFITVTVFGQESPQITKLIICIFPHPMFFFLLRPNIFCWNLFLDALNLFSFSGAKDFNIHTKHRIPVCNNLHLTTDLSKPSNLHASSSLYSQKLCTTFRRVIISVSSFQVKDDRRNGRSEQLFKQENRTEAILCRTEAFTCTRTLDILTV